MSRLTLDNTFPAPPFAMADTWGNAQVTVGADRIISVQISGRHYATDARLLIDQAFIRLDISGAHRLGEAILAASAAADRVDIRQTCLWSDATTRTASKFARCC